MSPNKQHTAYEIIHSMDASEKAYFKKYAFKRANKNNESYLKLFDAIDKQDVFNIEKIQTTRGVNPTLRSNIHASLNTLFKTVCATLIEYRKDKGKLSKLMYSLSEYELFKEKKLNHLAKKKLEQAEDFAATNKMYYFIPYIHQIKTNLLRNNIITDSLALEHHFNKIDDSKTKLDLTIEVSKFSILLESFFHKNGGVVSKNKAESQEFESLLDKADELYLQAKDKFLFQSVISSNRFIVQMVSGRLENLEQQIKDYHKLFDEKIDEAIGDNSISDINITNKNYAVVCLYLNKQKLFLESYLRLKYTYNLLQSEKAKEDLAYRLLHLKITNYAINSVELEEGLVAESMITLEKFEHNMARYPEMLLSVMMAMTRNKRFQEAIEISEDFIATSHNERIRDALISIRMMRSILRFKMDNFELFKSEITSVYKKIIASDNFPLQLKMVNILKGLNKVHLKEDNQKIIQKITSSCDDFLIDGTGTEQMKAMELKAIALLALDY